MNTELHENSYLKYIKNLNTNEQKIYRHAFDTALIAVIGSIGHELSSQSILDRTCKYIDDEIQADWNVLMRVLIDSRKVNQNASN